MEDEIFLAYQMLKREASNQSLELRERRLRRGPLLFRKWRLVNFHGWAGTNQVLISIDVINPGNGWPEFVLRFHKGLQGIEDGNDLGYFERFLLVEEIAMISPKAYDTTSPSLQEVQEAKANLITSQKKSNF